MPQILANNSSFSFSSLFRFFIFILPTYNFHVEFFFVPLEQRTARERKETKEVGKGVKISSGKNKSRDWRIDRTSERERERDGGSEKEQR